MAARSNEEAVVALNTGRRSGNFVWTTTVIGQLTPRTPS